MLKRDVVQAIFAPVALLFSLQAGCESRGDGDILELREEQPGLPRSATWGEYRATRHERTGREVVSRARLIATIVLQDDELSSVSLLPQSEIDKWEASARSDPYREGMGDFGYCLPVDQTSAIVPPRYLATYAVESGTADEPILSRKSLVGLSVTNPGEVPVELLGPL